MAGTLEVMKVSIFILLSWLLGYLFYPISSDDSFKRAKQKLNDFCYDKKLDCSNYTSFGFTEKQSVNTRFHEWRKNDGSQTIIVRVPYRRIGDLSFGLLAKPVTLGVIDNE